MGRVAAVIYLWRPAALAGPALESRCRGYAYRFCWQVRDVVTDMGGSNIALDVRYRGPDDGRPGLSRVLALLAQGDASVLLCPDRAMIGGTDQVFDAVNEQVERRGAFVQIVAGDDGCC